MSEPDENHDEREPPLLCAECGELVGGGGSYFVDSIVLEYMDEARAYCGVSCALGDGWREGDDGLERDHSPGCQETGCVQCGAAK